MYHICGCCNHENDACQFTNFKYANRTKLEATLNENVIVPLFVIAQENTSEISLDTIIFVQ